MRQAGSKRTAAGQAAGRTSEAAAAKAADGRTAACPAAGRLLPACRLPLPVQSL